jgi:hypothetical protein
MTLTEGLSVIPWQLVIFAWQATMTVVHVGEATAAFNWSQVFTLVHWTRAPDKLQHR